MALIVNRRNLYLHIPKTGGIWITGVLTKSSVAVSKIEDKHATYDLVQGRLRAERRLFFWRRWTEFRYFCVVRNPLTWYESWFRYQKSRDFRAYGEVGSTAIWHPMAPLNAIREEDFNAFMTAINDRVPGFAGHMFRSYTVNAAARILRNESLRQDLLQLNRDWEMGLDEDLILQSDPANVSPRDPIVWKPEVFERTVAYERATFDLYGYDWRGAVAVA